MLSSLFDEYSLNARVRPALLALLSLVAFLYLEFPQVYSALLGAVSIFIVFGLVTALAHFSRNAGRIIEKRLFSNWGGKPTTILLRHRDTHIDPITKERYHEFLSKNIDTWVAPTAEEELNDPRKVDQGYDSAVRWLLEYTRDQKEYPLLFKENINYGFRRNCYGIKWLAVVLSLAPIIVVVVDYFFINNSFVDIGKPTAWVSILLSVVLTCWWGCAVREAWVWDAATTYSIRLLSACESDSHITNASTRTS